MEPETCLFCGTTDLYQSDSPVTEDGVKEERSDKYLFGGSDPSVVASTSVPSTRVDNNAGLLKKQLRMVFIVRKLLQIEEERCVEYLQWNGGLGNPSSWISVCASCLKLAEEGYQVYLKIQSLSNQLEGIRRKLKQLVVLQSGVKIGRTEKEGVQPETQVQQNIIEFIVAAGGETLVKPEPEVGSQELGDNVDTPGISDDNHDDMEWQPDLDDSPPEIDATTSKTREYRRLKRNEYSREYRKRVSAAKRAKYSKNYKQELQEWTTDKETGSGQIAGARNRNCYVYKCDLCVAVYRKNSRLIMHKKLHEEKEGELCPCGWFCSQSKPPFHRHRKTGYNRNRSGRYQYTVVLTKIPYYCDYCHFIFPSQGVLIQHIKRHHENSVLHSCTTCGSSGFLTKQLLELHRKDKHPEEASDKMPEEVEDQKPEKCSYCALTFPTKLKKDYHIARKHVAEMLVCQICGYKARAFFAYYQHQKLQHEKEKIMCELCPLSFCSSHYLKVHIAMVHHQDVGVSILQCEECNVSFPSANALAKHMAFVHKKEKKCCCEFCGKGFSRGGDLKKHILLHTAPREKQYKQGPFYCEFCSGKFNVRQGLYYHMKKMHGDKYSFKCEFCGTGYVTQNTLLQHKRKCKMKPS